MMKSKALLLFLSFFLGCFSQEVIDDGQQDVSLTEVQARSHQTVDWDNARPPVTLTIRSGREFSSQPEQYGEQLVYSNQWRPLLMPLDGQTYGARIPKREEMEVNPGFQPTILKRPNLTVENSSPRAPQNPRSSETVRNTVNSDSVLSFAPMFFYPPWIPESFLQGTQESQNDTLQSEDQPSFYSINTESSNEDTESAPASTQEFSSPSSFLQQPPSPADPDNTLSPELFPLLPFFYPRPPPPRNERVGNPPIPTINVFARPSYVDREPGSDVEHGRVSGQLQPEKIIVQPEEEIPAADTPPANVIPPEAIANGPLPLSPYPFGVYPPPLLHAGSIPPPPLPPRILGRGPVTPPIPQVTPVENVIPGILPPSVFPPLRRALDIPEEIQPNNIQLPPAPTAFAVGSDGILPPSPPINDVPQAVGPDEPRAELARLPYEFGYEMNDGNGTDQHRREISNEAGVVTGSYGYRDAFGVYRLVNYIADKQGFRAVIKTNEPGVANPGSADVVVMAEPPPPHAIAEGAKGPELLPIVIPDQPIEMVAPTGNLK